MSCCRELIEMKTTSTAGRGLRRGREWGQRWEMGDEDGKGDGVEKRKRIEMDLRDGGWGLKLS